MKKRKYVVEAVLTLDKEAKRKDISRWVKETLMRTALREGWGQLMQVRIRSVDED